MLFRCLAILNFSILFPLFPVIACMGYSLETRTFLDKLPLKAMSKPVVAKVEIISSKTDEILINRGKISTIVASTKVVEALKGIQKGDEIKVKVNLHSCSREPKVAVAQTYYLAGTLDKEGIFHGEWKNSDLEAK